MSLTNEEILEEVCEEYGATYYWRNSSNWVNIAISETEGGEAIDRRVIWSISRSFFYPVDGRALRGMLEKRLVEGIIHNMGGESRRLIIPQISPEHLRMKRDTGIVTAIKGDLISDRAFMVDFIDPESRSTVCSPFVYNYAIIGNTLTYFSGVFEAKLEKIWEERG